MEKIIGTILIILSSAAVGYAIRTFLDISKFSKNIKQEDPSIPINFKNKDFFLVPVDGTEVKKFDSVVRLTYYLSGMKPKSRKKKKSVVTDPESILRSTAKIDSSLADSSIKISDGFKSSLADGSIKISDGFKSSLADSSIKISDGFKSSLACDHGISWGNSCKQCGRTCVT